MSQWTLTSTGNRVLLAVVAGWVVWFLTRLAEPPAAVSVVAGVVVGGLVYLATTMAVRSRRE